MATVGALFWDVGGVLLTNGWDREARRRARELFDLEEEVEERHQEFADAFELGRVSLEEYLNRTVFFRPRPFGPDAFRDFIFAQSEAHPEGLAVAERLAHSRTYLMATLNNEPLELNLYRIRRFGLRRSFTLFLSSCFLGVKKPDPAMYKLALHLTQRGGPECVFIDDRPLNVEAAREEGLRGILYEGPMALIEALRREGVEV